MSKDKINLNVQFQKYDNKVNNGFTKVKILVNTHEQVANGTHFSRELLESKMSKLDYLPIIAEFKEKKKDFGTHGGKVELSDDGIDFVDTTRPYGVIIEGSGKFEYITKPNGEKCEYVTCLGYVWSERYPELNVLFEGKPNNQSMEINVLNGHENDDGSFEITDFEYSALCILGKDVAPAFDLAKVETNFAKLDFKAQYTEMLQELEKCINGQEVDEMSKKKFKNQDIKETEDTKEPEKVEEDVKEEDIKEKDNVEETETSDDDKEDVVEDPKENEENDFEKKEQDYKDQIKALTDKCLDYEKEIDKYKEMAKEYEKLKEFKAEIDKNEKQEKIDALFSKVDKYMDEDMEELKEKAMDMEFEKLESSLYSLVGKKMIEKTFSLSDDKVDKDIINMDIEDNSEEMSNKKPYDDILKKYTNK